jgi:hypothetical protein
MLLEFTIQVEVERSEGKFAGREELANLIMEELSGADPGTLDCENGGTYEVGTWEVQLNDPVKPRRKKRAG